MKGVLCTQKEHEGTHGEIKRSSKQTRARRESETNAQGKDLLEEGRASRASAWREIARSKSFCNDKRPFGAEA
jgi:hypothetical protein